MLRLGRGELEHGGEDDLGTSRSASPLPVQARKLSVAETRAYGIGRFTLLPYRELRLDGAPVPIGRKALDLLSVLAEAEGELVTKDELAATAWPRTTVDDNVLQVHVAALRKLLGEDAERLTTARGLGYRLQASPVVSIPQRTSKSTAAPTPAPSRRAAEPAQGKRLLASAAVLLLAGAAAWPLQRHLRDLRSASEGLTVLQPFRPQGPGAGLQMLSDRIGEAISSALSHAHLEVGAPSPSREPSLIGQWARPAAAFRATGEVWQNAGTYHVHAHLDDADRNVVVWSDDFSGPVAAPASLEANVAARMANATLWARLGRTGPAKLDPPTLATFIAGRESTTGTGGGEAALPDYEQVVAASPKFSWGHSAVAAVQGFALLGQPATPVTQATRTAAQAEADLALKLDPHNGEAYLALELMTPRREWGRREALLLKGAAADPSFEPVAMMEGRLLWSAGRQRDATAWLRLAHDIDPFHNGATWTLALNLASEGWSTESRTLGAQMAQQWPDHGATKDVAFWTSLVAGDANRALALLKDQRTWPSDLDQGSVEIWRVALRAIGAGRPAAKARAALQVAAAADGGSLYCGDAAVLLTLLGDLDAAFVQARRYRPPDPFAPPYLFLPMTAPLREDRRFVAVARDLGLVAYWRASRDWPDFCRDPKLTYDCSTAFGS